MVATEQPTWDPAADPQAIPRFQATRPLLAAAPPPEVWAPPPELAAAPEPAEDAAPALIIVRERLEAKGAATGPQVKQRIVTLAVPDDFEEYQNFQFDVWSNPPFSVVNKFQSDDWTARFEGLGTMILRTNGWCDQLGEPYPEPGSPEFWQGERCIPADLMMLVIELAAELVTQSRNPNSRRARRPS